MTTGESTRESPRSRRRERIARVTARALATAACHARRQAARRSGQVQAQEAQRPRRVRAILQPGWREQPRRAVVLTSYRLARVGKAEEG